MKIFWMMPSKNYEGFATKRVSFKGQSVNYHMYDVLAHERRQRNVTSDTKSTYHRVLYLVNI